MSEIALSDGPDSQMKQQSKQNYSTNAADNQMVNGEVELSDDRNSQNDAAELAE